MEAYMANYHNAFLANNTPQPPSPPTLLDLPDKVVKLILEFALPSGETFTEYVSQSLLW
jgi:hypothetical protein